MHVFLSIHFGLGKQTPHDIEYSILNLLLQEVREIVIEKSYHWSLPYVSQGFLLLASEYLVMCPNPTSNIISYCFSFPGKSVFFQSTHYMQIMTVTDHTGINIPPPIHINGVLSSPVKCVFNLFIICKSILCHWPHRNKHSTSYTYQWCVIFSSEVCI